jgi:DNA-binding protein HU-beta
MNKAELIDRLAEACSMEKKEAKQVIEALFATDPRNGIIANALESGEKVQITGFGTFELRNRKARTGRNPRTGEPIDIPASRAPAFSAGKPFKERYAS